MIAFWGMGLSGVQEFMDEGAVFDGCGLERWWLCGMFDVQGRGKGFLSLKTNLIWVMLMQIKAIYKDEVLMPLQKLGLREKEEILIEIKKHRISRGILKVDPKIVDEVIENEELFE